jgi:hypothetical protein
MHQYRVELRTGTGLGQSKYIDVVADSHAQARMRAERSYNLLVLSTEFIA